MTVRQIALGRLVVADTNLRRLRGTPEAQKALEDSITKHGILVPLIVQAQGAKFGVIAGGRRLRAAKAVGLQAVPCTVRTGAPDEARMVSVTENTLREDFAPLEEAEIYAHLVKHHGDVATLAAALGRSEGYVQGRLALRRLVPEAQRGLTEGTLPLGHALEPARCAPADQARLLPGCEGRPVRALRADIVGLRTPLRLASWALDDATLAPKAGACSTCPFRTGTTPALFPEAGPEMCTNAPCFETKGRLVCARMRKERPDLALLVPNDTRGQESLVDGALETLAPWAWKPAKAEAKGAAEGLLVAGPRAGRTTWFVRAAEPKRARGADDLARAKTEVRDRRALAHSLVGLTWEALTKGAEAAGLVAEALLARLGGDDRRALAPLWDPKVAAALRGKDGDPVAPLRREVHAAESDKARGHLVARIAAAVVLTRAATTGHRWAEAQKLAETAGVDVAAAEAALVAARKEKAARKAAKPAQE